MDSKHGGSGSLGIWVIRLGLGAMFMMHGWPMLFGGPIAWKSIGIAMGVFGIKLWPAFWGFLAAATEFVGGACLVLGFLFRPACMLLAFTMATAALFHLNKSDGLIVASHAIEDGIVFVGLVFIGPGRAAMDSFWSSGKK